MCIRDRERGLIINVEILQRLLHLGHRGGGAYKDAHLGGVPLSHLGIHLLTSLPTQDNDILQHCRCTNEEMVHVGLQHLVGLGLTGAYNIGGTMGGARGLPHNHLGTIHTLKLPVLCVDLSLIHISEPTRLLSISYAVFCLKKKKPRLDLPDS
eukprot:TRINITY_DN46132_c0_g1_i1.p1 TRINITY_DN46132_c0_g1~~TRINITY_DN46132_c0_g1_i1.p1  ORF type:complete len:153 (-),score=18.44 TRINITY_DN46132_c0_g1_i1:27-485(-)